MFPLSQQPQQPELPKNDSGDRITVDQVREHLKKTRCEPFLVPRFDDDGEAGSEPTPTPSTQRSGDTTTVILRGVPVDLENSDELTPEQVKAILARTQDCAADHAKRTQEITTELNNTPSRSFRIARPRPTDQTDRPK